jgi:hypothetical protein
VSRLSQPESTGSRVWRAKLGEGDEHAAPKAQPAIIDLAAHVNAWRRHPHRPQRCDASICTRRAPNSSMEVRHRLKQNPVLFPYISPETKKGWTHHAQAFDFSMNFGGKCKFRTCDPCSVNAVLYP